MVFDFESATPRWNTWSAKWDLLAAPLGPKSLSLSVADMEFQTCPAVKRAIEKAAEHGIYGYTEVFEDFRRACVNWQSSRHRWDVQEDRVVFYPRIVQMISALLTYGYERPPTVATLMPAYGPILEVVARRGSRLLEVNLDDTDEGWKIPLSAMSKAMARADIFLLCSPHNPTGRVWTSSELKLIAEAALENSTLIVSDDIHSDFTRLGETYLPLETVAAELSKRGLLITCTSPCKTFNTAGLESAAIIVSSEFQRDLLENAKRNMGLHNPNYFAIPATVTAWNHGHGWVDALNERIDANIALAMNLIREGLPRVRCHRPEGTYLLWLDLQEYITSPADLDSWQERAGVAVSTGSDFGSSFEGYARLNVAVPPDLLCKALDQFIEATPNSGGKP
nr:aminotransferase class I/II-fold pyridoxal phosphate-dependent enzyme [Bowdeniella massiliensis]